MWDDFQAWISVFLSAGFHYQYKGLGITFYPDVVISHNSSFDGFKETGNERLNRFRFDYWNRSDIPERFGNGAYSKISFGQSKISYGFNSFEIALANFISFRISNFVRGKAVYNYVNMPYLTMNQLVTQIEKGFDKFILSIRLPYFLGLLRGHFLDFSGWVSKMSFLISAIRIKKFCATTQYNLTFMLSSNFNHPLFLK